ncbi:retrovirus-related pol polyprotein from transposon TNT 1-94 [Tanacetum coccineum]
MFHRPLILLQIVQLILFIVDSGCTKHMTGNLKLLCNFVEKFLGTVHFGNDQFAPILGYGDLIQGNVTIKRVYYVEGLNHNLFSVGQFCDADLEVAFRKSTCFVRDLQGNDLLTGSRGSDLYTISLQETTSSTPICFMAKASPTQAWLWHRRLSHLNFDYITLLSKKDVVTGLPKLTYVKDTICLIPQGQNGVYVGLWNNSGPRAQDKSVPTAEKRQIVTTRVRISLQSFTRRIYNLTQVQEIGTSSVYRNEIKRQWLNSAWIEANADELHQFDRLKVLGTSRQPFGNMIIKLKWLLEGQKGYDRSGL